MSARNAALAAVLEVIGAGKSLKSVRAQQASNQHYQQLKKRDQQFCHVLIMGHLRQREQLFWYSQQLLNKPFAPKDLDVQLCLEQALLQIFHLDVAPHAALNSAQELIGKRRKAWAKAALNAVLRRALREREQLMAACAQNQEAHYSLPNWLLNIIQADWQHDWQQIAASAQMQAPTFIRINHNIVSRDQYLAKLTEAGLEVAYIPQLMLGERDLAAHAIALKTAAITTLPAFKSGVCSVQDLAAQIAAQLLKPQAGDLILDACAAPGGKSAHLLELAPSARLCCVDIDPERLIKVAENLARSHHGAELMCADIAQPSHDLAKRRFNKILLDAPCSATGIMRRQPDIKIHRREADIDNLCQIQKRALSSAWQLLAAGGSMLYCTCSIIKRENERQIAAFLNAHPDATLEILDIQYAVNSEFGSQLLSGNPSGSDGFFFALMHKGEQKNLL